MAYKAFRFTAALILLAAPAPGQARQQEPAPPPAEEAGVRAEPGAGEPAASDGDIQLARRHYQLGEEFYHRAAYDKALDQFRQSYKLVRKPQLLFNMARCNESLGQHREAGDLSQDRNLLNCGDKVKGKGEDCDTLDLGSATCQSLGYSGGSLACSKTCTFIKDYCYRIGPALGLTQVTAAAHNPVALAGNGTNLQAVWAQGSVASAEDLFTVHAATGSSGLTPGTPLALSNASGDQQRPVVAASTKGYIVLWSDNRNDTTSGYDLYAARLDQDGHLNVADQQGKVITSLPGNQDHPALACSNGTCLVAWDDGRQGLTSPKQVYATRLASKTTMVPMDPSSILLASGGQDQAFPALAVGPSKTLVVAWTSLVGNTLYLRAAQITP